jgi:hypothetical protein
MPRGTNDRWCEGDSTSPSLTSRQVPSCTRASLHIREDVRLGLPITCRSCCGVVILWGLVEAIITTFDDEDVRHRGILFACLRSWLIV